MRKLLAVACIVALLSPGAALFAPSVAAQGGAPAPQAFVSVTETASLQFPGRVVQAVYSPDGRYLAVAAEGDSVRIVNSSTLAPVMNITTPPAFISLSSLSWGPDSDVVGMGYQGGAVAAWRISTRSSTFTCSTLGYDVKGVAWSPDGQYLAAGIVSSIFIFDVGGNVVSTIPLQFGASQPAGLSWSHDSDYIAVGQQAFSPFGAIVAVFESEHWSRALISNWVGPQMDDVAFDGRARFLAMQLGGSRIEVWQVRNWTFYANISSMSGLEHFAWTRDGSRIVTLETEPSSFPNQTEDYGGFDVLHLGGGANNSSALGVTPDGKTVAIGYADGSLRILAVGGERLFDDQTSLLGTTGDPITFSVRSTLAGTVRVVYTDAQGGRGTSLDLTAAGNLHTLTVLVPSDWVGPIFYHFVQASSGLVAPERLIRVTDNDAPTVDSWNFTRIGQDGTTGVVTLTVSDNIKVDSAAFQIAVDGAPLASFSVGGNRTYTFSYAFPISAQNRTVRLELTALDDSNNGGALFQQVIALLDLTVPRFGADLSQVGTAGGHIQLGTVATDERGAPTVWVRWRELTVNGDLNWSNFTYSQPTPGSSNFVTTFPLSRTTVAVEYSFAAVDAAGNANSTETRVQSVLDLEPPEFIVDLSDREVFQGDDFHLAILVRDNIGTPSVVAYVQEDGGLANPVNLTAWPTYGDGAFEASFPVQVSTQRVTYEFFATDQEGNTVGTGKRTLLVKDNDPPVIRILESALRVTAGASFTFHVEVTDRSNISNLTMSYRREGETSFSQVEFRPTSTTFTGPITAHFSISLADLDVETYKDGRSVLFYLYALDGALNGASLGTVDAPLEIKVIDGAQPTARLVVLGDLVTGSLISFDGSGSDDDMAVVAYTWTVDGVEAGNGSTLSKRFETVGSHTIKLTVRDAANKTASETKTLSLTQPPAQAAGVGGSGGLLLIAAAGAAAVGVFLYMRQRKKPGEPDQES